MYETNLRRVRGREKKAEQLEDSGSREQHSSESLGISLGLIYPRIEVKEVSSLEMPMGTDKSSSNRWLLFLAKGAGKGQLSKTENLWTIPTLLQSNAAEKKPCLILIHVSKY